MSEPFSPLPMSAIRDSRLTKTDLRVLAALYYRNGSKGCFPSRADLCELTDLWPNKVSLSLVHLKELGWVKKEGRSYLLLGSQPLEPKGTESVPNEYQNGTSIKEYQNGTSRSTESVPQKYQNGTPKGTESVPRNRTKENYEENNEENYPLNPPKGGLPQTVEKHTAETREVIDHLNQVTQSAYTACESNAKHIRARLNDGMTVEDLKVLTGHQAKLWLTDSKMRPYLRPQTLYGTKAQGYLSDARRNVTPLPYSKTTAKNLDTLGRVFGESR